LEDRLNVLEHVESFFLGLDIGRSVDYSALSVIARKVEYSREELKDAKELLTKYYAVYVHRFPLGTPYYLLEEEVDRIWKLPELRASNNWIIVDKTGVGAPVVENIRRNKGLPVQGVTITGGEVVNQPSPNEFNVPKSHLVTALMDIVQRKRFKVMKGVDNEKEFFEQVDNFGYKINRETANMSYEALQDRVHDDLVISAALAIWFAERVVPYANATVKVQEEREYNPLEGVEYDPRRE
jgi:hypothetical protein